jgi:hypothetical protein
VVPEPSLNVHCPAGAGTLAAADAGDTDRASPGRGDATRRLHPPNITNPRLAEQFITRRTGALHVFPSATQRHYVR